jgi:hypothetical protein
MKKRGSGFSLDFCHSFVKGDSYPEICAQRDAEGGGFPFVVAEAGPAAALVEAGAEVGFLCNVHISLRDEGQ